ncbi:MAG TPA: phosphomannomutase/phosphoglucomutase, partial [Gemmatimonadaceae bacterium]|nr:phosphomannomutase/phosphoglucomutase [Gemmatimonadaceae bacterium]
MTVASSLFRQYDVRGVVGRDLTPEAANALGRAFALLLNERAVPPRVAVSRDNRPSGAVLREALVAGLVTSGVTVVDLGIVPTPVNYWAAHHLDVAAGIQITGSHNPPEYNGFKLGIGAATLHGDDIQHLYALTSAPPLAAHAGAVEHVGVLDRYVDDIVRRTGPLARPIRVVYDCGNGAASVVAPALFGRLGVHGRGLYCESDGTFPNHHPDPTVPENLRDLIAAVRQDGAELGIAFDGDGDRIGVVDEDGAIVWGDRLLILYARDAFTRTGPGQPVIFDVKCSQALPLAIEAAGGRPVMWKTGHSL